MPLQQPGEDWYDDIFRWNLPAFGDPIDSDLHFIVRFGGGPLVWHGGRLQEKLDEQWPRGSSSEAALAELAGEVAAVRMNLTYVPTATYDLPTSEKHLLVRTDFSDESAWAHLCEVITEPSEDGFHSDVAIVDDPRNAGASFKDLRWADWTTDDRRSVLFIADSAAMAGDLPILCVDLADASNAPIRCIARRLYGIDANLAVANMDFEEFADSVDADGVFRGFSDD